MGDEVPERRGKGEERVKGQCGSRTEEGKDDSGKDEPKECKTDVWR
jgi:hypothetical protein